MCGRFALTLPIDAVAQLFDAHLSGGAQPIGPRYNICPTQTVSVIVSYKVDWHLVPMRWGFLPHWYNSQTDGPLLINARAETIAEKPAFREACRRRRCILPATGFYEWKREGEKKTPYFVRMAEERLMLMAGVWQAWTSKEGERVVSCAVVTTEANARLGEIHHRMPVLLTEETAPKWLGEEGKGASLLMHPAPDEAIDMYPVSSDVNTSSSDGSQLIEPVQIG